VDHIDGTLAAFGYQSNERVRAYHEAPPALRPRHSYETT